MIKEIHGVPHDLRLAAWENFDLWEQVDALDAVADSAWSEIYEGVRSDSCRIAYWDGYTVERPGYTTALCATPCTAPQRETDSCNCPWLIRNLADCPEKKSFLSSPFSQPEPCPDNLNSVHDIDNLVLFKVCCSLHSHYFRLPRS